MRRFNSRIKLAIDELERLCTRQGMITTIQSVIETEVDLARLIENLDAIVPLTNAAFREKESVEREEALAAYQEEEKSAKAEIEAARLVLERLIFHRLDVESAVTKQTKDT